MFAHLVLAEDDDLEAQSLDRFADLLDEGFGVEDVGRRGDEVAGEFEALRHGVLRGPCGIGAVGCPGDRQRGQAHLLLVGQLGAIMIVAPCALGGGGGETRGGLRGGVRAAQVGDQFGRARGQQPRDQRAARLAPAGFVTGPDADQQQLLRLTVVRDEQFDDRARLAVEPCRLGRGIGDRAMTFPQTAPLPATDSILVDWKRQNGGRARRSGGEGDLHLSTFRQRL